MTYMKGLWQRAAASPKTTAAGIAGLLAFFLGPSFQPEHEAMIHTLVPIIMAVALGLAKD